MKPKTAVSVILCCVLIGVIASSYVEVEANSPPRNFTLTAAGRAYDRRNHQYINVRLSMTGTTDREATTVLLLYVKGGDLQVQNYGSFPVARGFGIVVQRYHYIKLTIRMTSQYYGGQAVVWHLNGKTGTMSGNVLPVSFYSGRLILPLSNRPQLSSLSLDGTLTLT